MLRFLRSRWSVEMTHLLVDEKLHGGAALNSHLRYIYVLELALAKFYRSTASATEFPPPRHNAATPFFASRLCISCNRVTSTRAPLAPMGCPIATAPPFTFTRSKPRPNSF